MDHIAVLSHTPEGGRFLSKIVFRICEILQLPDDRLAGVIEYSYPENQDLTTKKFQFPPKGRQFYLGRDFVCLFLLVDKWLGHDDVAVRSWFRTFNIDLRSSPLEIMTRPDGMRRVLQYVRQTCLLK